MQALSTAILAQVEISPKFIFGMIFLFIWGLSAFVSWVNKRQQEARRQQVQRELEQAQRMGRSSAPPPPPRHAPAARRAARRQISEGIAQRFPDVLLPPAPP
ncbi:MAG: hypothetical protein M3478_16400, partial [Planctomycetota bacterium]|nr:hypothetical protein [Planctomycetota bacterium]